MKRLLAMGCGLLVLGWANGMAAAPSPDTASVDKAIVHLAPTKGNKVQGTVRFETVKGGVKVTADLTGLTPGKHGFHVHEKGDCSAPDGSSAGGHFNPTGQAHGGPDATARHEGDLGNLVADASGAAHYERVDQQLTLQGPNSILGRSVVVHAKADDFKTQPSGASGDRVALGKIEPEK
ncbi:MAG: superoxide dismutase family protein [Verrucomicrobiae bacterium]|nr:superoxide dismutase family protein [Verrucomicrobiae bacterium]